MDSSIDLIVWYAEDRERIVGFQLCYGKGEKEKALTWHSDTGYLHSNVDDGEGRPYRYKMAPILMSDGFFHAETVYRLFLEMSRQIDREIADFVSTKIIDSTGHL